MLNAPWTLARRAARMNPSIIREILKVTEKPGILSMAGGLPSADTFPIEALKAACDKVLTDHPREALQYAASEGFGPLREWAAARVEAQVGLETHPDQVLITSGSQQGLDLVGKLLCDQGAPVAVETPTYLGALQAFTPYEPQFVSLLSDGDGPDPEAVRALPQLAPGTRFMYLLPNYQNPTGRVMPQARRDALVAAAQSAKIPFVEDNPYGDLWFDEDPGRGLAARWPEGGIYLGSFSKILTPGFRLGYVVAPKPLYPKLLQAKQAADLHTPGFNQRVVHEVIRDGFLDQHIPKIRALYKANRDAMAEALQQHLPEGCEWRAPLGGMFFWIRLPEGLDAMALLPTAVDSGIAYVPGAAFFAHDPDPRAMRLSFVTLTPDRIREGVAILGRVLNEALNGSHAPTP
ncbi:PLP-dependent aminotransferase family protein [Inhella sp.]|uniref:aminotransferase-like domain-containing protein n=1 Tax=Inhella sp. TaxID=1921806 RepID=UPI0035B3D342